jgi:hypothetical protein
MVHFGISGSDFATSKVRTKLKEKKYATEKERTELEGLIKCAAAVEALKNPAAIMSLPWSDLLSHVEALEVRHYKLTISMGRAVTKRRAVDMLREMKLDLWLSVFFPSHDEKDGEEDDDEDEDDLEYLPTPSCWDRSDPQMKYLLVKREDNQEDLDDMRTNLYESVFTDHLFTLIKSCDIEALKSVCDKYLNYVSDHACPAHEQSLLEPVSQYFRCICSLVFPDPFRHGCSAEEVALFFPTSKKGQKKIPLATNKIAGIFVDHVRVSTKWQSLHAAYVNAEGGENTYGKPLREMYNNIATAFDNVLTVTKQKGAEQDDDDDDEDDAVDKEKAAAEAEAARNALMTELRKYGSDVQTMRAKLRPKATAKVDDKVAEIVGLLCISFLVATCMSSFTSRSLQVHSVGWVFQVPGETNRS